MPDRPRISYSQNFEDVRLWRALGDRDPGFFVDIGAGHPTNVSVTRLFYDLGWRGINVEPGPMFDELQRDRSRDINIRAAVGPADARTQFWIAHPYPDLSSLSSDVKDANPEQVEWVERVEIDQMRLSTLLAEYAGDRTIDFLKIDVEGAELEVIESGDWQRFRPTVVVVEAIAPGSHELTHAEWEPILLKNGYLFAVFDGINRFYTVAEHADLIDVLAYPVSDIDRFDRYTDLRFGEELTAARAELTAARAELTAARHRFSVAIDSLRESGRIRLALTRERLQFALDVAAERDSLRASTAAQVTSLSQDATELRSQLDAVFRSRTWRLGSRVSRMLKPVKRVVRRPARAALRGRRRRSARQHVALVYERAHVGSNPLAFASLESGTPELQPAGLFAEGRAAECGPVGVTSGTVVDALTVDIERSDRHAQAVVDILGPSPRGREALVQAELVVALAQGSAAHRWSAANDGQGAQARPLVVVDVRCLQNPDYEFRGVGRHAKHVLEVVASKYTPAADLAFLIDPCLEPLDDRLAALAVCSFGAGGLDDLANVSLFVELSPMTASPGPTFPFLLSPHVQCVAVVYDFIPSDFPGQYLSSDEAWIGNRACLDALARYDRFLTISEATASRLREILGSTRHVEVTGVENPLVGLTPLVSDHARDRAFDSYLLAPTGGDARKNLLTAVAAHALCYLSGRPSLGLVVVGNLPTVHEQAACALSQEFGVPADHVVFESALEDVELAGLYANAELVVIPSFAEGFSIPVVEALGTGSAVVASRIAAHQELLGGGWWLAAPDDPIRFGRAVARGLRNPDRLLARQRRSVAARFSPGTTDAHLATMLPDLPLTPQRTKAGAPADRSSSRRTRRAKIGVLSPFPPQRTGVGFYSAFTFGALANYADVVLYTNAEGDVPSHEGLELRPYSVEPFLRDDLQAVVSVVGNSTFHIPILEYFLEFGGACIAHDNRMTDLYRFWRGDEHLAALLSRHSGQQIGPEGLAHLFTHVDELPALAYDEIALRACPLMVHSQGTADRINHETGVLATVLPFVPHFLPTAPNIESTTISEARGRLGWNDRTIHIATFGIVHSQSKAIDVLVDAATFLAGWGVDCHVHVVGAGPPNEVEMLEERARALDITRCVSFTGWTTDEALREHLLAADVAVQLRTNALAPLSGALLDCIAFGTPTIATASLAAEMAAPSYVTRVADKFSAVTLAEAILRASEPGRRATADEIDKARRRYLAERTDDHYARRLLEILEIEGSARTT